MIRWHLQGEQVGILYFSVSFFPAVLPSPSRLDAGWLLASSDHDRFESRRPMLLGAGNPWVIPRLWKGIFFVCNVYHHALSIILWPKSRIITEWGRSLCTTTHV